MIGWIIKKFATSVLSRWVAGSLVLIVIGTVTVKVHNWKEDLIHKGQQVCVQEINKQTVIDLEAALAAERVTAAQLRELVTAAAAVNAAAIARRGQAEESLRTLQREMEAQRNEDPEYREWVDTTLPGGVAERVRNQAAGRDSDTN